MELDQFKEITSETYDELRSKIAATRSDFDFDAIVNEYDIANHSVMDNLVRRDKVIYVPDPTDSTGVKMMAKIVPVNRVALSYQKLIVDRRTSFLCGNPIKLIAQPNGDVEDDLIEVIEYTWEGNKLDYDNKKIAKILFSETEVAELWYLQPAKEGHWDGTPNQGKTFSLRMRVLSNGQGDKLYPIFNSIGDMIAFARGYEIPIEDKMEQHFDIYTDEFIYEGVQDGKEWLVTPIKNVLGKIPVIYYSQPYPEWADVQFLIERLETLLSNHADINDYNGSPFMVVTGSIVGFSAKGETGKVLEVDPGGDVKLLSWDHAPESIKLEIENLIRFIGVLTQTPDISFESMRNIGGGTPSGYLVKLMFTDAHMAASDKEEIFGKCMQRRINLLKSAMTVINPTLKAASSLKITPKFEYYLPNNDAEKITMLVSANGGKAVMSQQTSVNQNPLIEDYTEEEVRVKAEADEAERKIQERGAMSEF